MRFARFTLLFVASILLPVSLNAQQAAQRDQQAVQILTQCLIASGGTQTLTAIQDFTGTGTITYFWAGQQVQGSVTVRGLGVGDFRLDADLPDGTRTWAVIGGKGAVKEADGKTSKILYENALNLGSLSLPNLQVLAMLNDPSIAVTLAGQKTFVGKSAYDIRVQRTFSPSDDPTGNLTKLNVKDFLVDAQTYTLLGTEVTAYANDNLFHKFQRALLFSDYRQVNGTFVPFSITEKIADQETWTIQLQTVTFNNGLEAAMFQF